MKKLSIILIIVGILIAASPLIGQWYTEYQENKMINEWLDSEDAEYTPADVTVNPDEDYEQLQDVFLPDNSTAQETSADNEVSSPTTSKSNVKKPVSTPVPQKVLGIIKIKKIKVKAPIVEGVKSVNLKVGVGHIPGTAGLGSPGNCALAGHRSYTFGRFFNRLDELEVGDEIEITTKTGNLKYQVYEKLVVKPNDVSVLKGSKDKKIITLITCTPIYVASHRLIIHASLVENVLSQP